MQRMIAMVLLFILGGACCAASSPETDENPPPAAHSKELEALSLQWMDAMVGRDKARLEELMAPGYVLHTVNPQYQTPRAIWLDNLYNHLRIDHWKQTDISAQAYGEVGVVTSTYAWSGVMHGHAFDATGRCTDVWRFRDTSWQVVSRTCMDFPDHTRREAP